MTQRNENYNNNEHLSIDKLSKSTAIKNKI